MAFYLILIILFCGTCMVLSRRLMHIVFSVEKNKIKLEESLRDVVEIENDDLEALYEQYMQMEKNEIIEKNMAQYKKCVNEYFLFCARQPWKTLAWILKLPPAEPIS